MNIYLIKMLILKFININTFAKKEKNMNYNIYLIKYNYKTLKNEEEEKI